MAKCQTHNWPTGKEQKNEKAQREKKKKKKAVCKDKSCIRKCKQIQPSLLTFRLYKDHMAVFLKQAWVSPSQSCKTATTNRTLAFNTNTAHLLEHPMETSPSHPLNTHTDIGRRRPAQDLCPAWHMGASRWQRTWSAQFSFKYLHDRGVHEWEEGQWSRVFTLLQRDAPSLSKL